MFVNTEVTLTDAQFDELKKLIQNYLKITAIAAIREISESEIERNARLLSEAGFSQRKIGLILHTSQRTIARILAGTWKRKKVKKG